MAQVTIYLDDEINKRLTAAARAQKVSKSKWIAMIIREKTAKEWPDEFVQLAGAWEDFPSLEEIRLGTGEDAPRESI